MNRKGNFRHQNCARSQTKLREDNWLLAPSLSALQDMLNTCQEFAAEHNLKFSTDKDLKKCKTKCMAFLHKPRELRSMMLCGNPLPWVDQLLHLGNMVSNKMDGGQVDMKQKEARYIDKNCTINQEFSFAHPICRFKLNKIYNCHFSGFQTWDLFSRGAEKFYSTFNRSVKVMADLPYSTHRYLIEPLSEQQHMSLTLFRNYLNFIEKVKNSSKKVLRQMYTVAKADVRTTTGSNLRNILLLTNLSSIDDLQPSSLDNIRYHEILEEDTWRITLIKEAIDIKCGHTNLPEGWTFEEFEEIINFACSD